MTNRYQEALIRIASGEDDAIAIAKEALKPIRTADGYLWGDIARHLKAVRFMRDGGSISQLSEQLCVSKGQARQIFHKGLRHLKHPSNKDHELRPYAVELEENYWRSREEKRQQRHERQSSEASRKREILKEKISAVIK